MQDRVRILVLGRPGVGKSSLSNTVLGADKFHVNHSSVSQTPHAEAHHGSVRGLQLTVIDSPAICSQKQGDAGKLSSMIQSSPGPHVILLVLKIDTFMYQEHVVRHMVSVFGEEVFDFTIVVFTHGDDLPDYMDITDFISANPDLRDLVQRCGGRCHVVDHRRWNTETGERSNQHQLSEIFRSIEYLLHNERFFTNQDLRRVEEDIKKEQDVLKSRVLSEEDSREQAKRRVQEKYNNPSNYWRTVTEVLCRSGAFIVHRVLRPIIKVLCAVAAGVLQGLWSCVQGIWAWVRT